VLTIELRGWRAYALGVVALALLLAFVFAASLALLVLLAAGAVALVAHRALRALGLIRPGRSPGGSRQVIEGEYRVVERGGALPGGDGRPPPAR